MTFLRLVTQKLIEHGPRATCVSLFIHHGGLRALRSFERSKDVSIRNRDIIAELWRNDWAGLRACELNVVEVYDHAVVLIFGDAAELTENTTRIHVPKESLIDFISFMTFLEKRQETRIERAQQEIKAWNERLTQHLAVSYAINITALCVLLQQRVPEIKGRKLLHVEVNGWNIFFYRNSAHLYAFEAQPGWHKFIAIKVSTAIEGVNRVQGYCDSALIAEVFSHQSLSKLLSLGAKEIPMS